jgi:CheY-like chemotaxis protein
LTNAVKFTPKGGRVAVKVEQVDSHFAISVTDSGEGIDAAFLPHVFERFRQADASSSRRHGGLGLGLSIVKQLVELHGGHIEATSEGSGKGAKFTVTLPVMASSNYSAAALQARERPARLRGNNSDWRANLAGVKILVVDDEPDARSLLERLLEDCDATVTTAASASEALELVARDKPDLLLSDIGMPLEDGYTLMRRIRNLDGDRSRIPAIALTAYARAEDRVKAIQAGYQMHLAKPVEPIKLVTMVASLVRQQVRH